jgi:SAM-dependent methyltransferase
MTETTQDCQLCGSNGPHQTISVREMMFGTRERFEYFGCAECDTLQTAKIPPEEELAQYYGADYYSYRIPPEPLVVRWLTQMHDRFHLRTGARFAGPLLTSMLPERVVKMLAQLSIDRDARILDVGCGAGKLLDRLAQAGFTNLSGADPYIDADGETPLGVALMKRHLSEVPGEFDLIMFNHSLEHVPDPVATLRAAKEKLRPEGVCLIRIPTTSSDAWSTYKADWVQIDAPRHIVIPSREGMARAANSAGLRVDETIDDSFALQFSGSEKYRRDVPLRDPRGRKLFGPLKIWKWEKEAALLNAQGRGDQAGFVLRVGDGPHQ